MKRLLLLWYQEGDNFGDILIAETTSKIIGRYGYEVVDYEVGDEPERIIEAAKDCSFMLFAGGGIIERYLPPILNRFSEYIERINIPYGVIGVSVGEFNYDWRSISLGIWVDKAYFFYVRDVRSKEILDFYSKNKNVVCSGDCVFLSDRFKFNNTSDKQRFGINVRDIPYLDVTGDLDWNLLIKLTSELGIDSIIMDSSGEITRFTEKADYDEYIKKSKDEKLKVVIKSISECKMIIAMRYHVILVASLLNVPCISIKYTPKVERLVEQLGVQNLSVSIGELDRIPEIVSELRCNYDEYLNIIEKNVKNIRNKVDIMYEDVIQKLNII